jgi:hypothetical protein
MIYKIEELDLLNDSLEEQERTRIIFEDLKNKAMKGEELSEHEKDFFCQGVKLSKLNDGKIEDYSCCNNYKFKMTYLSYFQDLTGFGQYEKVKGTSIYNPDRKEIDRDIEYLKKESNHWNSIISKTNHDNELLQQISKETRNDLKIIEKSKGRLLFRRDKEKYELNKRTTLLHSKYIYCMAQQIFEMFNRKEFVIKLNGFDIEINEYSIIHILNRHYSEITKPNSSKSFHIEDFKPKYLNKQIGAIFQEIENSGLYKDSSINKISFWYNNIDYSIWVNKRTKQVKGQGNVSFLRLETFYPVDDQKELSDLIEKFYLKKINNDLSVYIMKE